MSEQYNFGFLAAKLELLFRNPVCSNIYCFLGHTSDPKRITSKNFLKRSFFLEFFLRTLALLSLVLGLGHEHSCPWPRESLSSERLSLALASDFFVSLALASSLVSSTPPLVRTSKLNEVLMVMITKCLNKIKQATVFSTYSTYFIATKAELNWVSK